MSTRCSIKWREQTDASPGFHLYDDCLDVADEGQETPVYLRLDGVSADMTTQRDGATVTVEMPREMARELGLLPAAPAPSVGADGLPWQGGMSNAELLAAWSKKLPSVAPKDNELSAFALGVEVGFERARQLERMDWDRVHHALKDAGVHPGRTDDHLADVIARALASRPVGDGGADTERLNWLIACPSMQWGRVLPVMPAIWSPDSVRSTIDAARTAGTAEDASLPAQGEGER